MQSDAILSEPIQAFLTLAESGSFTKTAQLLGISQPSVTRRIELLENQMGVELIERNRRPVTLTAQGRYLESCLVPMRKGIAQAVSSLKSEHGIHPALRLGVIESFSLNVAPFLLQRIRSSIGNCACVTGSCDRLLERYRAREIDVIISSDAFESEKDLRRTFFLEEPSIVVLPHSLGQLHQEWTWQRLQLCGLPFIYSYRHAAGAKLINSFINSHGIELTSKMQSDNIAMNLRMVAMGMGWLITRPTSVLQSRSVLPNLTIAKMPTPLSRQIYLLERKGIPESLHERLLDLITDITYRSVVPQILAIAPWLEGCIYGIEPDSGQRRLIA